MNSPSPVEFDCAIVLGAQVMTDGQPSPALVRRVAHAVALARAGAAGNLLMSGGPVGHPRPEALVMRELALAAGIAPARLHVEDASRDTIGNARLSGPIIRERGWRRLLLVTDSFHMPRARLIFRRHGLTVIPSAVWPDRVDGRWLLAHGREILALAKTLYRLRLAPPERLG